MKLTVITGKGGKIIGTARHVERSKPEMGDGGPIAGPGQSVHVIDLPRELERMTDPEELHRHLKTHVSKGKKK
jgi:hypothetical protein